MVSSMSTEGEIDKVTKNPTQWSTLGHQGRPLLNAFKVFYPFKIFKRAMDPPFQKR